MKKLIVLLCILATSSSYAGETCTDLRFEAKDFLCTLEAKLSSEAIGTPEFKTALKEKMACLNNFTNSCDVEENSADFCDNLRFEALDSLCTLEAFMSSEAIGTPAFKEALKAKIICLDNFSITCLNL